MTTEPPIPTQADWKAIHARILAFKRDYRQTFRCSASVGPPGKVNLVWDGKSWRFTEKKPS